MKIVPFHPQHLEALILQPSQSLLAGYFKEGYGDALVKGGPSFTGVDDDGNVVGCSGVVEQWENRAIAWALLSDWSGKHFVKIHKAVKRFLDSTDYRRIEAFVDAEFEQGHRWVNMLGFEREGYMRSFNPDGRDAVLYARIR
jgi:RimJ/RimL family protein N-acetyltransferase